MKKIKTLNRKEKIVAILNYLLFAMLFLSFIYSVIMAIVKKDSSYAITINQSIIGMAVLFIPLILDKKFKLDIPIYLKLILVIFVYLSIFLGEVKEFYYLIKNWDLYLHTFSGMIFAILSISLITLLNNNREIHLQLSPVFVALFTFCFSVTVGALWEIFEFTFDQITGSNMQKFMPEIEELYNSWKSNLPLNGTDQQIADFFRSPAGYKFALMDTMEDIIVDTIGAFVVSFIGYFMLKNKSKKLDGLLIVKKSGNDIISSDNLILSSEKIDENVKNQKSDKKQ